MLDNNFCAQFQTAIRVGASYTMHFTIADLQQQYEILPALKPEVEIITEWLRKQPHLTPTNITELQIALYLYGCYRRIEHTKIILDNYFTFKTHCPDLLDALPKEVVKQTLSVAYMGDVPQLTNEGYNVAFMKLLDTKVESFHFVNILRTLIMVGNLRWNQIGLIEGVVAVADMKGFSLAHLGKLNITMMRKGIVFLQDATALRLKAIHFINAVPFVDKIMALVKPFLNSDLYNAIHFHTNYNETLYDFVPKSCLPKDYGGDAPSVDSLGVTLMKNISENFEFYAWHDRQKVDENKRLEKLIDIDRIFGMEGTFRKLEID